MAGLGGCLRYSRRAEPVHRRAAGPPGLAPARPGTVAAAARPAAGWTCCSPTPRRAGPGDGRDPAHHGFAALPALVAALAPPAVMLHGHVRRTRARTGGRRLGRTQVRNVAGRHLLDIAPGAGARRPPLERAAPCLADTGFPRADVENDFLRARRRQVLARLAPAAAPRAGRRQPDPAVRRGRGRARHGAASDPSACRRSGWSPWWARWTRRRGLRPPVPAHLGPGARAVGAAGPGPAAGRVDPAHRRVPGRRHVLRRRTATTGCRSRWPPARR